MYRVIKSAMYDDKSLAWSDKEQWLMENLGFSEDEARDAVYALEGYTDRGFHAIHNQDFSGYLGNDVKRDAASIDSVLLHPKMPKYQGTLYRGLRWPNYKEDELEDILDSGLWREPGITSFTSDKSHAMKFMGDDMTSDGILLMLEGNRHACEVGFLSQIGGEGEVLYPSTIAKTGLRIVDWDKEVIEGQRISRKTGKPIIIRTNYFVTVRDV